MDVYIFRADIYCEDCARTHFCFGVAQVTPRCAADCISGAGNIFRPPNERCCGARQEYGCDTTCCPQGPYADGGGEGDAPQHCGGCGVFLENPLTTEGRVYLQKEVHREIATLGALSMKEDSYGPLAAFYGLDTRPKYWPQPPIP